MTFNNEKLSNSISDFWQDSVLDNFLEIRPVGGFKVIYADPPWAFKNYSEKGEGKSAQHHYQCMDLSDICKLPVEALAADDCVLFIWVTWPMLDIWNKVIKAWGFEYKSLAWEWIKYNPETKKYAFGGGYGTRKNLEPCLMATKGNPSLKTNLADLPFDVGCAVAGVRSVRDFIEELPLYAIHAPRREHSRKPDEAYNRIETMFDGPYVELFGRGRRNDWSSWGNELDKFAETGTRIINEK